MLSALATLLILTSAAVYFLFNREFFRFASLSLGRKPPRSRVVHLFFLLNFSMFLLCTLSQFPLMLNWSLFGLLLFLETLICFRCSLDQSIFLGLQGILCGLSSNIFNRCYIALIFNQSLAVFDNNVSSETNLKSYPVILGFLTTALVLRVFSRPERQEEIRLILSQKKQLRFLIQLMTFMYLYLLLHLLLYGPNENELILKLWGLASCGFVIAGYYLGLRYTLRLCRIARYREQNYELRQAVADQQRQEQELSETAYRDDLTGLFNRKYAQQILAEQMRRGVSFCLCFADLDGLKVINDRFGHSAGDAYLLAVSRALRQVCGRENDFLFRYGGDEFIALLPGLSIEEAGERMEQVNHLLVDESAKYGEVPLSISYGITSSADTPSLEMLIQMADSMMYRQKRLRCRARDDLSEGRVTE